MPMIETFPVGLNEFILLPKHSTWTPSPEVSDDLVSIQKCFDPNWLTAENLITKTASGRGFVYFFFALGESCVLRHYYRGGLVAKLSNDKFISKALEQSRPYKELNLLAKLHSAGLKVPKPIAARLKRTSFAYTADIITAAIPNAQELHEYILKQPLKHSIWEKIGATLHKMHDLQACHDDINVKNVLLQEDAEQSKTIYLLDFDGCRIRDGDAWKNANLARFKRSLEKQKARYSPYYYEDDCWESIERGYRSL
ncbi:MAG: 3-deoxy-D-manno-octulosonic acid kinase [Glaciecola sp.]|jgi:3-deoxy-D-manno-octulosonic acid kinase